MGVFETILTQGVLHGQIPARTQEARNWYRIVARAHGATVRQSGERAGRIDYGRISENKFMADYKSRATRTILPGSMYMYHYDPKYKEELPFYDRFPMIFPFRVQKDRFWGINLHYLPLQHRAILMDALYDLRNNSRFDETTILRMSYKILNSSAKLRYFKPCVHQYLFSHMKSSAIHILPSEWDIALMLPLERFVKKTKAQVWSQVKKGI